MLFQVESVRGLRSVIPPPVSWCYPVMCNVPLLQRPLLLYADPIYKIGSQ